MVTIEQKIRLFSKLISQDIENEIGEKMKRFEEEKAEKLEQVQSEANRKAHDIYKANENKIKRKTGELTTRSRIENRRKILEVKENLIKEMIIKLEEKAKAFTHTPEYEVYMEQCISQATKLMGIESPLQIFIRDADVNRFKHLFEKTSFNIMNTQDSIIGGILVVNPKNHTRVDLSIRARLEDKKSVIVNKIMKELEEVGDELE